MDTISHIHIDFANVEPRNLAIWLQCLICLSILIFLTSKAESNYKKTNKYF